MDNSVASYWIVVRHLPLSTGHSSIHSPVFEPLSGSAYSFSSRPTRRVAEELASLVSGMVTEQRDGQCARQRVEWSMNQAGEPDSARLICWAENASIGLG